MDKRLENIAFGNRVREIRLKNSISQEELAFRADLGRTYIGMIERAEKNISLSNIYKLAKGLNVHVKDFFTDV